MLLYLTHTHTADWFSISFHVRFKKKKKTLLRKTELLVFYSKGKLRTRLGQNGISIWGSALNLRVCTTLMYF